MKTSKLKCHGHKCRDRFTCKLYTSERVKEDDNAGDDSVKCEYYDSRKSI
jgi:hypothetical protein